MTLATTATETTAETITATTADRHRPDPDARGLRRLTGCKPTGRLHLGNLLGAIRPLIARQQHTDSIAMIADLHALTVEHDPARVRALSLEQATVLLAAGVDPARTTLYLQSHLAEHSQLHYLLECVTGYGEAHRMIAFKDRSRGPDPVRLSLLTYPVLMAADILLHDTDEVPVGEDQTQHLELARDVATRFNARYGPVFTVPRAVNPQFAGRIMDLTEPTVKMGKSSATAAGVLGLLDPPDTVRRKIMRAVTDPGRTVTHDRERQPGVTNLLEIYLACGGRPVDFTSYGQLKSATTEVVVHLLEPVRHRYRELSQQPEEVSRLLREGADSARRRAAATLRRAGEAIGLVVAEPLVEHQPRARRGPVS